MGQRQVFISYHRDDGEVARRVREHLVDHDVQTWMDQFDIPVGAYWPDEIDKGLTSSDIVVGILSADAVESRNVKNEWDWAIQHDRPLFLLQVEPTTVPHRYVSINFIDMVGMGLESALDRILHAVNLDSSIDYHVHSEHEPSTIVTSDHLESVRPLSTRSSQPPGFSVMEDYVRPLRLPNPMTSLIGRDRELDEVGSMLRVRTQRLITLTGIGGVGKTRLAIAVAHEAAGTFADGAYFVDLSSIADAGLVVSTIASAFGIREAGNQSLRDSVVAFLRNRHLLLVLDNFEHVLDAAQELGDLLEQCSRLQVLATSRARLNLAGEQEYALSPLSVPDVTDDLRSTQVHESEAIKLFVQRAHAVRPDLDLADSNLPAVIDICRRLDGLPLAIELAAARVKLLSPEEIAARLEQPLALLTGGARNLPVRQRTMRDAIRWSYDLLISEEQALLRQLSSFVGGCTLDAAEQVATDGLDVIEHLGSLVDYSLVVRRDGPGGEPRFALLETIREFALEQLNEAGEAQEVQRRHADYYLALAEAAEPGLRGGDQQFWLQQLHVEHHNLRAALARGSRGSLSRVRGTTLHG